MKYAKTFVLAAILICALNAGVRAGDISTPGASQPPPPPVTNLRDESPENIVLNILLGMLSLY